MQHETSRLRTKVAALADTEARRYAHLARVTVVEMATPLKSPDVFEGVQAEGHPAKRQQDIERTADNCGEWLLSRMQSTWAWAWACDVHGLL